MNQTLCATAYKLVKESSNSQLLPINSTSITEIIEEINKDYSSFYESVGVNTKESYKPDQYVLLDKINRNKRAACIYLNERLKKLKQAAWLYSTDIPEHIKKNLDENDEQFFNEYNKNLQNYYGKLSHSLDLNLTKNIMPPSDSVMISVKAEESIEHFKINDNSEKILIEKGCTYLFPKIDVEPYVRRGIFSYNE